MDGRTDEGPFHLPAPEQLPAHSPVGAGNSRFLLLIDAVLIRGALLQLAGSSEAMAVPMPALSRSLGPQDTGHPQCWAGTSHRLGVATGNGLGPGSITPFSTPSYALTWKTALF